MVDGQLQIHHTAGEGTAVMFSFEPSIAMKAEESYDDPEVQQRAQ